MKITIYELLGLVKEGKAPKKVLVDDSYYEYNSWGNDYADVQMTSNYWLFKDYTFGSNGNRLNTKIEIIEEEKETEELDLFKLQCTIANHYSKENIQCLANEMVRKMNKLRDAVNELKKEGK